MGFEIRGFLWYNIWNVNYKNMSIKLRLLGSLTAVAVILTTLTPAFAAPSTTPPNGDVTPSFSSVKVGSSISALNTLLTNLGLDDIANVVIDGLIVSKGGVVDLSQSGFNEFIVQGINQLSASSTRSAFKLSERTDLEIESCDSFPTNQRCGVVKGSAGNISFDSLLEVLGAINLYSTQDNDINLSYDADGSGTISSGELHTLSLRGPRSDSGTNSQIRLHDIDLIVRDGSTVQSESRDANPIKILSDIELDSGVDIDLNGGSFKDSSTRSLGFGNPVTIEDGLRVEGNLTLDGALFSNVGDGTTHYGDFKVGTGSTIGRYTTSRVSRSFTKSSASSTSYRTRSFACPTTSAVIVSCTGHVTTTTRGTYQGSYTTTIDGVDFCVSTASDNPATSYTGSYTLYTEVTCFDPTLN